MAVVRTSVAISLTTQVPYFALVAEEQEGVLLDLNGAIPGSSDVVKDIIGLFGPDGVDIFTVFDLYAAAFGCTVTPLVDIPVPMNKAVEFMQMQLASSQGGPSPARQAFLNRVAYARSDLGIGDYLYGSEANYDPARGLDALVPDNVRQKFLYEAGWEPYRYDESQEELLASEVLTWAATPDEYDVVDDVVENVPVVVDVVDMPDVVPVELVTEEAVEEFVPVDSEGEPEIVEAVGTEEVVMPADEEE